MKRLVLLAVSAAAMVSFADTHVWTNATSANPKFTDGDNWQSGEAPDVSSNVPSDPSNNYQGESVDLSQVTLADGAKPQTILLPKKGTNGHVMFNVLSGNCYQQLISDYSKNGETKAGFDQIWLRNAANFAGLITHNPAGGAGTHNQRTIVGLIGGATLPLADGRNYIGYCTHYNNTGTIGQLAGTGVVPIGTDGYLGQGTTTFARPSGPETSLYIRCGSCVLNGYTTSAALVSGAILHFDASDASTLTVSGGQVTEWRDKSGKGIVATTHPAVTLAAPCENPGTYAPTAAKLAADLASGLPVVNFGVPYSNRGGYRSFSPLFDETLGSPAALKLSSAVSGVKDVFFVFRDTIHKSYGFGNATPFALGTESGHANLNPFGRLISDVAFCNGLFGTTGAAAMIPTSAVFYDGQRIIPSETQSLDDYSRRLHVVSCGLSDGAGTIENLGLGCDATGNIFYGGLSIAEVIAYDRTLTPEERHQVNAYLRAKWQPDAGTAWDYGSVWVSQTDSGSYKGTFNEVAAGVTAIRDLQLRERRFEKTGAGTLVVGRLHGFDDYEIVVKGGAVRLEPPAPPVEERAADPLMWFDATQVSSDKILHSNDVDYVTEIVDPRPDGKNHHNHVVKAIRHDRISNQTGKLGAYATLQAKALNGKPVFNFGEFYAQNANARWGWETTGSSAAPYRMTLSGGQYSNVMREGFIVARIRPDTAANTLDVLPSGNYDVFGGGLNYLVSTSYSSPLSKSALWRVNGEIVNPMTFTRTKDDFYLISVSLPSPTTCSTIAIDRNAYSCGGLDVAEMLVYDRTLTDAERVNTEAYLMKKWFNRDHPNAQVQKVKIISAAEPERLVQDGKGAVELSGVGVAKLKGVDVTGGGTLKWAFDGDDLLSGAKVHLDATQASTLTTTGGTWVTTWEDVRANGYKADADRGGGVSSANITIIRPGISPTLTTATLGGKSRNVIDFGDFTHQFFCNAADSNMRTNALGQAATSSAMRINLGNAATDKGAEFYVIHADAHNLTSDRNGIMGIQENGSDYIAPNGTSVTGNPYPFLRNGKKVVNGSFSKAVARGEIYVDGVKSSANYEITADDQFHLFAFYPEVPERARGLAMRTSYERGGQKLGEVAIFTETNTPAMREKINAHLMKKWFDVGAGVTSLALQDIRLADGGTFELANPAVSLTVGTVVGDGTVKAKALAVSDGFTFKVLADAKGHGTGVTSLDVDGTLTLPATGRITITLPAGLKRIKGKFPLISATTLVGDLSGIDFVCDCSSLGIVPSLSLEDGVVYVDFPPKGMLLLVR